MLDRVLEINTKVKKPRGLNRTTDEAITLVWTFWDEYSTVSNAQTSRPAKCSTDDFAKHPLLSRIDIEKWNIQEVKTKRNKRQYVHQYHVQNTTKEELFKKFKKEHPSIKMGITTFTKIKPFLHPNKNAVQALLKALRSKDKSMKIKDDDNNEIDVLSCYQGFMKFLYKGCSRNGHGLLTPSCESGVCGHWNNNWNNFKVFAKEEPQSSEPTQVYIMLPAEDTISFQRFEYEETEKDGRKLAESNTPMSMDDLLQYITAKMPKFVVHSSERFRDFLFWKIWLNVIIPSTTLIYMDFSENLSLPVQKEPQSMYWIRKQISIHCEIVQYRDKDSGEEAKVYSGHFSDDRDHNQVYVRKCLDDLTEKYPVNSALVIRSDNATHFKSAENFSDLQDISNNLDKMVIRAYGVAGHGKGEIDSCGGHLKNPVRQAIANKVHITSDMEAVDHLMCHYADKTYPAYDLQTEREKRLYMEYKTVQGSDSFHVLIFQPGSETFLASNKLCVCAICLDLRFDECESFSKYQPLVGRMNEKVTRSKTDMVEDVPELTISNMVTKNTIFAIRAENARTNYFLILCESEEQEHLDPLKPYVDECGNAIHYGTKYLLGKYLDIRDFNDK